MSVFPLFLFVREPVRDGPVPIGGQPGCCRGQITGAEQIPYFRKGERRVQGIGKHLTLVRRLVGGILSDERFEVGQ